MKIKKFNENIEPKEGKAAMNLEGQLWGNFGDDRDDDIKNIVQMCETLASDVGFILNDDKLAFEYISDYFKELSR